MLVFYYVLINFAAVPSLNSYHGNTVIVFTSSVSSLCVQEGFYRMSKTQNALDMDNNMIYSRSILMF